MGYSISMKNNNIILADDAKKAIEELMHTVAMSQNKVEMEMLGQELVAPIKTIADYISWTDRLLAPLSIGETSDPKIPIEQYDVQAFYTAVDGQVMPTRVGYQYNRFEVFDVDCAFEILWKELRTAPFDILGQKMKRAAEELARKRDSRVQTALETAAAAVDAHDPTVATTLTKSSVDSVLKLAAQIGLPIKNVAINSGTILDMRGWDSSTFVWQDTLQQKILIDGAIYNYGNANWYALHTVPTGKVYFCADPMEVGYFIRKGELTNASDVNILKKTNLYTYNEEIGTYIGNNYGVWVLEIT